MDLGKVNWKPSGKNSSLRWDSWEEIIMPAFTGKKLIPTLMMKLKGSRLQVEELIEYKVEIARELELEVEPEDKTGSLQCHDKIFTDEGMFLQFSSVQFSHSVVSNSLRPYGLQHTRPHYPSPTPGAYSNSCPLSRWCHPTISSSVIPFSSCLQSFPASSIIGLFQWVSSSHQVAKVLEFPDEEKGSFLRWNLLPVKIHWRLLKW